MLSKSIFRLEELIKIIPELFNSISETEFSSKPSCEKWSKKEILGHLIDSAANNHQRFIRGQFEDVPTISYDQNQWNELSHYNEMNLKHIINFWTLYNQHILEIISRISAENLQKKCRTSDGDMATLQFLIEDYIVHLEHHLHQIVSY